MSQVSAPAWPPFDFGLWRLGYRNWNGHSAPRQPAYTVLLPVPGDLPVFLFLAMDCMSRQDDRHRLEVIVVSDRRSDEFDELVAETPSPDSNVKSAL